MSVLHLKYKRLKRQKRRNIILNIVCLLIAGSGLVWTANYFWRYINYEITNDAFVDQYIAPVNVRVAGYIQEVRFREHQFVHEGDTLVVLDNREYLIRQKEAEASLLDAQGSRDVLTSGIRTSHTRIAEQDANLAEAKARLWQTEQDYRRYERLLKEESVPEQQYDQAKASYEAHVPTMMLFCARRKLPTPSMTKPARSRSEWKLGSCVPKQHLTLPT